MEPCGGHQPLHGPCSPDQPLWWEGSLGGRREHPSKGACGLPSAAAPGASGVTPREPRLSEQGPDLASGRFGEMKDDPVGGTWTPAGQYFLGTKHKVQPPGSYGAHQVHRPLSLRTPLVHWRPALGVWGGTKGPGDCHLHGRLGCLSSLGVTRGRDRCRAQLPSGAPLGAWPGLALIDYTGASAWAQVAGPGQPLAPSRHGPAGDRGVGKKEGTGGGVCEPQLSREWCSLCCS